MEAERVTELLSQMSISDEVERNSLLNSVKPFFLRRDAGDVIKVSFLLNGKLWKYLSLILCLNIVCSQSIRFECAF